MVQAIDALAEGGPGFGRPLVDTITGSKIQNLKELRPGTVRSLAEQRYEVYLKERQAEQEDER